MEVIVHPVYKEAHRYTGLVAETYWFSFFTSEVLQISSAHLEYQPQSYGKMVRLASITMSFYV